MVPPRLLLGGLLKRSVEAFDEALGGGDGVLLAPRLGSELVQCGAVGQRFLFVELVNNLDLLQGVFEAGLASGELRVSAFDHGVEVHCYSLSFGVALSIMSRATLRASSIDRMDGSVHTMAVQMASSWFVMLAPL